MNAKEKLSTATLRKSSERNPQADAANAYSRLKLVLNTPGSSVLIVYGWPCLCTCDKWWRAASDAEDISFFGMFESPSLSSPPSSSTTPFSTDPVITLLVIHSSIGIFKVCSLDHNAASLTVLTQCPNRSGLNFNIEISSFFVETSPQ